MEAASCLAVVYDTTRLSHLTPLEVGPKGTRGRSRS